MARWRLAAGLFVVVVALLFAGVPVPAAAPMDTLLIGTTDKITHLSPENSYDYWTWHVFGQVSEALVQFKPGTTTIVGQLAQSWRVSPTGTAYTFILRKGVTFTDGSPFNAAAVKASLDRILRLKGPEGASGLLENIKSIDVVDDLTVRINLAERDATFLSRMTWGVGAAHIYNFKDAPPNDYSEGKFVGTGPYRIAQYAPGERMVFEAYPGYWGDKPKTRQVIEVFFADASALAAAVESGQVDVGFRSFNPQDLIRLRQSARVTVIQGPSLSVRYLVFNVTAKPFDDVKVRRGIAYAVDRDKIAQNVFGGLNTPLYSMEPPGMWSHIDAFPKRNLDQARSQLSEAGYSQGKKLAIPLWFSPTHYGSTEADAAAVVKQAIEETGMVSVDVKSQEWAAYSKAKANGEYGLFFLGWFPDFVDPDNFLTPWLVEAPGPLGTFLHKATSTQDKQYYNQFVKLLGDATRVTSQALRTKYYEQAQQLLAESAILVPLWSNNNQAFAVTQKNVDGILLTPDMNFRTWSIFKK